MTVIIVLDCCFIFLIIANVTAIHDTVKTGEGPLKYYSIGTTTGLNPTLHLFPV
jgi:hypothetical protein